MISSKRLRLLLLLGLIIIGTGLIFGLKDFKTPTSSTFDPQSELKTLKAKNTDLYKALIYQTKSIIQKGSIDGAIALSDQALIEKDISFDQCHNLLHLIGHEAYSKYQTDFDKLAKYDSRLCIASFEHGIEGEIVKEQSNVTANLENYCTALRKVYPGISCYHGAGHGYMQSLKDPLSAVKGCDLLSNGPDKELWNCYRGVFSEYANEALGTDSDTGLPLSGPPPVRMDFNNPYSLCDKFASQYQDACYSQFTKVFLTTSDANGALNKCLREDYTDHVKEICVSIVSGVSSRATLSNSNTVLPLSLFYSLPKNLKQAYISGVRESFGGYQSSNLTRDWQHFCGALDPTDQLFCLNSFKG